MQTKFPGGRVHFVGCSLVAILPILVTGCGVLPNSATDSEVSHTTKSPIAADMPPNLNASFRWVPADALDLMSAEGTFVRAYTESFELAFQGQSADWGGYPGFIDASPRDIDAQVKLVASNSSTRKVVNTVFYRPLRRVDTGPTSRLVLCRSESLSIEQRSPSSDSEWRKIGKPWGGYPVTIEFTRSANGSPPRKSNRVP